MSGKADRAPNSGGSRSSRTNMFDQPYQSIRWSSSLLNGERVRNNSDSGRLRPALPIPLRLRQRPARAVGRGGAETRLRRVRSFAETRYDRAVDPYGASAGSGASR